MRNNNCKIRINRKRWRIKKKVIKSFNKKREEDLCDLYLVKNNLGRNKKYRKKLNEIYILKIL
jgi:hypothetical protein